MAERTPFSRSRGPVFPDWRQGGGSSGLSFSIATTFEFGEHIDVEIRKNIVLVTGFGLQIVRRDQTFSAECSTTMTPDYATVVWVPEEPDTWLRRPPIGAALFSAIARPLALVTGIRTDYTTLTPENKRTSTNDFSIMSEEIAMVSISNSPANLPIQPSNLTANTGASPR